MSGEEEEMRRARARRSGLASTCLSVKIQGTCCVLTTMIVKLSASSPSWRFRASVSRKQLFPSEPVLENLVLLPHWQP